MPATAPNRAIGAGGRGGGDVGAAVQKARGSADLFPDVVGDDALPAGRAAAAVARNL